MLFSLGHVIIILKFAVGGELLKELTQKQKQIYDFISEFILSRGYPPSVREIGEAVGLRSPSTVHMHLGTLEKEGYTLWVMSYFINGTGNALYIMAK